MIDDTQVRNKELLNSLCDMFVSEYTPRTLFRKATLHVPSALNAIGACAGFAAQAAVWRELILPQNRNPGDFLVYVTMKSNEIFFLGDAVNLFLFSTMPDRVSFLSVAGAALANVSEFPDISELVRYVSQTLGGKDFGRPRVPQGVELRELPQVALAKTWNKAEHILQSSRPALWPALLGAAALRVVTSNKGTMAPPIALRVLLEAAVPMSKLNPTTIENLSFTIPPLTGWSRRAMQPESHQQIVSEVRSVMLVQTPPAPATTNIINRPVITFLNLSGTRSDPLVAKDSIEIGSLFRGNVHVVTAPAAMCDVLFLYCAVEPSGKIAGQTMSLRDLIGRSGARVAVVASEVPADILMNAEFQKSLSMGGNPPANLVITGNRNGEAFGRFFKSLFQLMWEGIPMPVAWAKLAPQSPQQSHDIPGTICLVEAGQVAFGEALRSASS